MFHVSQSFLKNTKHSTLRRGVPFIVKTLTQQQQRFWSQMSRNRGTGAGGSNTNRNGLPFERCVCPPVYVVGKGALVGEYLFLKQHDFIKHMKPVDPNARLFKPDGAFIRGGHVILMECKYQSTSGSADEKILNSPMKLELYKQAYPRVKKWKYILVLSEWFKQPSYDGWIAALKNNPEIDVWWAKSTENEVQVKLEVDEKSGKVRVLLSNHQLVP